MLLSRPKRILQTFVSIAVTLGLLLSAPSVGALAYGSGSYGACEYGQNCSQSSGGSSSAASNSSTATSTTAAPDSAGTSVLLNDFSEYFTESGKSLDVQTGQVIYFNVDIAGTAQKYSITIQEIGADYVVLVIASPSQTVRLTIGQTGQYDVNGDGQNDIAITLNSIADNKANLTFRQLGNATKTTAKTASPTASSSPAEKNWWPVIFSALALFAGLALFLWLFISRRSRNKD